MDDVNGSNLSTPFSVKCFINAEPIMAPFAYCVACVNVSLSEIPKPTICGFLSSCLQYV